MANKAPLIFTNGWFKGSIDIPTKDIPSKVLPIFTHGWFGLQHFPDEVTFFTGLGRELVVTVSLGRELTIEVER